MTIEIPLTRGLVAIIDDVDWHLVDGMKFYAQRGTSSRAIFYAVRTFRDETGKLKCMALHRLILSAPKETCVDHINHDGLDNRRANIRLASRSQNAANMRRRSGRDYVGVQLFRGKYVGFVCHNKRARRTAPYDDPRSAAIARDVLALKVFGEYAYLNFPDIAGLQ